MSIKPSCGSNNRVCAPSAFRSLPPLLSVDKGGVRGPSASMALGKVQRRMRPHVTSWSSKQGAKDPSQRKNSSFFNKQNFHTPNLH